MIAALRTLAARLRRDETGTALVELAMVIPLLLLLFFGLIDFGRMAFNYSTTEKAVQMVARRAVVSPGCAGVSFAPYQKVSGQAYPLGTACRVNANACQPVADVSCNGASFFDDVAALMPVGATADNLRITYSYDPNLGFLGGPYTPMVTVEIANLAFDFVSPLAALVSLAGGTPTDGLGATTAFPPISVSLPAESLGAGS
ncbi:TadE family protein [Frigidibacter sp. MR17.14]|uniref:TadE/TadG family type IV pilus assembly protein n=1 Tax=Frigidibacter sp. MR17.14 TaxID=3126509 RepID=UPI003012F68F